MTTKHCSKCGKMKSVSDFYKDRVKRDGLRGLCKSCDEAARTRRIRQGHPPTEAQRKKFAEASRIYRLRHPEKAAEAVRKYRRNNQAVAVENARRYANKYPERIKAVDLMKYAVRTGRVVRGPCFACGATKNVHGHHEDYDKPYEVIWLCPGCHYAYHAAFASQ